MFHTCAFPRELSYVCCCFNGNVDTRSCCCCCCCCVAHVAKDPRRVQGPRKPHLTPRLVERQPVPRKTIAQARTPPSNQSTASREPTTAMRAPHYNATTRNCSKATRDGQQACGKQRQCPSRVVVKRHESWPPTSRRRGVVVVVVAAVAVVAAVGA